MSGTTAWVLGDQLSHESPVLEGARRVLLVESGAALARLGFHRQKLHLILVAMRSFAGELEERGFEVDLRRAPSLADGLKGHLESFDPDEVLLLEPHTLGAGSRLAGLSEKVRIVEDGLFLTSPADFAEWAEGRKQLRMEDFYRTQRKRFSLLMDGDGPMGGQWNFDAENRKTPEAGTGIPRPYRPRENSLDEAVRSDLDQMATSLPMTGSDGPRIFPATRAEALRALDSFIRKRLAGFGPFQDAMIGGERYLWHALISTSLNLGLLGPLECARAAERAYRDGEVPISSAEGFIRQVIGWREYVWGVYRLRGSDLKEENALGADRAVPRSIASLDPEATEMACLSDVIGGIRDTGYAHHIERLMVLGNLMLLLGVDPKAATDWFHRSFVDGYEWVMVPNVSGMALWADGGRMMSKPYAASGRYIDRMSDHCGRCRFSLKDRSSDDACPFTVLYWDFLARNRQRLAKNHRMKMSIANLDRIDEEELRGIRRRAAAMRGRPETN